MKNQELPFREISLKNFLSFGPAGAPIPLTNLNVIILADVAVKLMECPAII